MGTVNQPTALPTRKLTAAMIAYAAFEILEPIIDWGIEEAAAATGIAFVPGPYLNMLIQGGLIFAAGYMIKDRPNVEVRDGGRGG